MNFNKHVHSIGKRCVLDFMGCSIVDGRYDDQNAIRAKNTRFHHLVRLKDEILAQCR